MTTNEEAAALLEWLFAEVGSYQRLRCQQMWSEWDGSGSCRDFCEARWRKSREKGNKP